MKRFLLVFLMMMVCACGSAQRYGVGAPIGVTPMETGELYLNTSNMSVFKANSTNKGDWSKLEPVVANGSADAPFDPAFVGSQEVSIIAASLTFDLTSSLVKVTTSAAGDILRVADGEEGQLLTVLYAADAGATNTLVIIPTNLASFTDVTLNSPYENAKFIFVDGEWVLVSTVGGSGS
jgi:hypothetical protein